MISHHDDDVSRETWLLVQYVSVTVPLLPLFAWWFRFFSADNSDNYYLPNALAALDRL